MEIKKGTKLRIKTWEQMLAGGGRLDEDGDIEFPSGRGTEPFVVKMGHLCGKEFVAEEVKMSGRIIPVEGTIDLSDPGWCDWEITTDMVEIIG